MDFSKIISVLQSGDIIEHPTKWKNVQNLTNAIVGILSVIISVLKGLGYHIPISNDQIIVVAGGIASVMFGLNILLTTVSSEKVGILPKKVKK